MSPKIQIICGPTGSGKTDLAFKQIGDTSAILITVDSRQLYQGLPITSGWDTDLAKTNIRFVGFGHFRPDQKVNAVEYAKYVREVIDENFGKRDIYLVGGSGFYIQAIIHPEKISTDLINPSLRTKLEQMSVDQLRNELKRIAPEVFTSLNNSDQNNPRRLVRRLEILSQPPPLSKGGSRGVFPYPYQTICLPVPTNHRELIKQRIEKRLNTGSIEEVKKLLADYPDITMPIYTTIGVKQIIMFLNGQILDEEMKLLWLTDEVNYVKRQLTWFKKLPR